MIRFLSKAISTLIILIVCYVETYAQSGLRKKYQETETIINSLIHTKLDVRFSYVKTQLYGKAWLTLEPYAYPTDSLTLDAKGMDIKSLMLINGSKSYNLKFTYDSLLLKIQLDKTYTPGEKYTVFIDYTANPNQLERKGSSAIREARGLYFINPDSSIKGKPVQIWTQGETESSSCWFPTIDKPNQKTTQEISITAPSKYITLSNGTLVSQRKNNDGTRTDTWKMSKPHAPYLFMMAVGDFKIYRDKSGSVPVEYYLEPTYAPYAKQIFGRTPEMMEFFEKKLKIPYPWNKYAQVVVRDFVSGAMENTTSTIHGEFMQQTEREILDGRGDGEFVIAHELFHQWLGNYVTAESWSNLSVNESFADLSETLWTEYHDGKDAGDAHNYNAMQSYLNDPNAHSKTLIRFNYEDQEEMFDVVTYQKGGRILNMLRNYLGDEIFYKGINTYLTNNSLSTGEAHQVRLAFEKASGKDLNWFFNQWYFRSGHPELTITYKWDSTNKKQVILLNQTQREDLYILPMKIDFYVNGEIQTKQYWMTTRTDSLIYKFNSKPDLINVDADKILLLQKTDNKSLNEYYFQFKNAKRYVDRQEALIAANKTPKSPISQQIFIAALKDPFYQIRLRAFRGVRVNETSFKSTIPIILELAKTDENNLVRAAAIDALGSLKDKSFLNFFKEAVKSESYAISGAALYAINNLDKDLGYSIAKSLENNPKGPLTHSIVGIYSNAGKDEDFIYVITAFKEAQTQIKFQLLPNLVNMMMKINNLIYVKDGIDEVNDLADHYQNKNALKYIKVMLTNLLNNKKAQLEGASEIIKDYLNQQIEYIQKAINKIDSVK